MNRVGKLSKKQTLLRRERDRLLRFLWAASSHLAAKLRQQSGVPELAGSAGIPNKSAASRFAITD